MNLWPPGNRGVRAFRSGVSVIADRRGGESRPGGWDVLSIGAFDALLALMDQAQWVCGARMELAASPFGTGDGERERWLGVSRRITGWRRAIHPDNREAIEAARAYCTQVINDFESVRPLHDALPEGRARALTPDRAAVLFDGRWWVAGQEGYLPLDPADAEQAGLIAIFERYAAQLSEPAREEPEPDGGIEQREDGEH